MLRVMTRILARLLSQRDLMRMTATQRAALVEALLLTLVAPGPTPDEERLGMRLDLLALPWAANGHGWPPSVGRRTVHLVHADDVDFLLPFAKSLAHELVDRELKEMAYRIVVALYFADGGTDRDLSTLVPIQVGLDVASERAEQILEHVKDDVVGAVL